MVRVYPMVSTRRAPVHLLPSPSRAKLQVMLALFSFPSGELVLILAMVLMLVGARRISDLRRGLRRGLFEFRKRVVDAIDGEASDAGRSAGGIFGKAAFQAMTPDNQVAELYNPGREEPERKKSKGWRAKFWSWLSECFLPRHVE